MKTNSIGTTGVRVTELGFGAAPIGNLYRAIDDDIAAAAVESAWDNGIRYFDTAPHYGLGLSELRLGRALAGRPRSEFAVSTKVGRLLVDNPDPVGSDLAAGGFDVPDALTRRRDHTRDGVLASVESSLLRLGLDRLDIVYVHDPEDHLEETVRETIPALVELREAGVIGAIGVGMNFVAPLRVLIERTPLDVIMVAGRWTLTDRSAAQLLADCAARGVGVVAAAPFNSGLLARAWPVDDANFDYGPASPEILALARRLAGTCLDHGVALPHVALQFPAREPVVVSVVAGMRTRAQVVQDVRWMRDPLPEDLWPALEQERRTSWHSPTT